MSYNKKMKNSFDYFEPNPDIEEIPTFTFENDRNLDNYKERIYDKEALIEMNAKNYLSYIQRYERKKANLSSPYSVYQKIKQNNYKNYNLKNEENYENKYINNINIKNTEEKNKINNMFNDRYFKLNEPSSLNIKKPLPNSLSTKTINYENRNSEITNPELYYKRNNEDYYKYRTEMKQYLDYNYKILSNKDRLNKKQEVNINPYNPLDADFEHYKSDLPHNPILNPVNNYSFNKYLEKEIKDIKKYENNPDSNYNNINKKNTPSTFQQVGNYLINK